MRLLLLAAMPALLMAGCLSDDAQPLPTTTPPVATPETAPADIVFEGSLAGYGDVSSNAPCALEDSQCVDHEVKVPDGTWNVTFTLVGTSGTVTGVGVPYPTDYDLFVEGVGESTNPGGQDDVVKGRLAGGSYTAQVVAWHDIDGSYKLTVHFEP